MKYIVAVSGGVDSVVLLDMLAGQYSTAKGTRALPELQGEERFLEFTSENPAEGRTPPGLIVAHFDHGIREDSTDDARFVAALAKQYDLPFATKRESLGAGASEATARQQRYKFLDKLAHEHQAMIVTAHHQDDMIGSIAINCLRGTGWRGLAVMNRAGVKRPLLAWTKRRIYDYALEHRLEWVEDETNRSPDYLRNRLRASVAALETSTARRLVDLRCRQIILARDIDRELARLAEKFANRRYPYTVIDPRVAVELLRYQYALARPQAERLLYAIKTARSGTQQTIGDGLTARYTKDDFCIS